MSLKVTRGPSVEEIQRMVKMKYIGGFLDDRMKDYSEQPSRAEMDEATQKSTYIFDNFGPIDQMRVLDRIQFERDPKIYAYFSDRFEKIQLQEGMAFEINAIMEKLQKDCMTSIPKATLKRWAIKEFVASESLKEECRRNDLQKLNASQGSQRAQNGRSLIGFCTIL